MNICPMTKVNILEFCKLTPQKTHKKLVFHVFFFFFFFRFFSSENSW